MSSQIGMMILFFWDTKPERFFAITHTITLDRWGAFIYVLQCRTYENPHEHTLIVGTRHVYNK